MGTVEQNAKKKRRSRDLHNAVLATVGIAGVLALAAVAPNAVQLLNATGLTAKLRYRTKTVLSRLKQKGQIEFVERNGKKYARLTSEGEKELAYVRCKASFLNQKPKKWDKRYRLVIFDIPERRRKVRERLRYEMQSLGFLRVQDSAWLYPYDCEDFIALLKADLHIGKDVLYAVVEEIENDTWIRKHFDLSSNS